MCLGIPMRVLAVDGQRATCAGRGLQMEVDTLLVGAVAPGQWLLTFLGAARGLLDESEAEKINGALDALEAMQSGESDLDRFFADLVNREPQLPEFLRSAHQGDH